jgi:hypothetical protein
MFREARFLRPFPASLAAVWLAAMLAGTQLFAAPDDQVVTEPAAAGNVRVAPQRVQANVNFVQSVFPGATSADIGRQRLESRIALRLAEIDRVCQLSDAQKQKLRLAARGDLQRFLNEVDELRGKFEALKNDQQAMAQMWQEIRPLQLKQISGLTGEGSLLMKVLPTTLDRKQAASFQAVIDERRRFNYRSAIASSLTALEAAFVLRHSQREAIAKLLLEETRPPLTFGQHNHSVVMYRLASLPEEKVEPLLDERQWQVLREQFDQYRRMGPHLVEQGVISPDELHDAMDTRGEAAATEGGRK